VYAVCTELCTRPPRRAAAAAGRWDVPRGRRSRRRRRTDFHW